MSSVERQCDSNSWSRQQLRYEPHFHFPFSVIQMNDYLEQVYRLEILAVNATVTKIMIFSMDWIAFVPDTALPLSTS